VTWRQRSATISPATTRTLECCRQSIAGLRDGEGSCRAKPTFCSAPPSLGRKQVTCLYRGKHRELCPHVLGTTNGQERALAYQFAGQSNSSLPPGGDWRCLRLHEVRNTSARNGDWHTGVRTRRRTDASLR
jgi:hypothetical protein